MLKKCYRGSRKVARATQETDGMGTTIVAKQHADSDNGCAAIVDNEVSKCLKHCYARHSHDGGEMLIQSAMRETELSTRVGRPAPTTHARQLRRQLSLAVVPAPPSACRLGEQP